MKSGEPPLGAPKQYLFQGMNMLDIYINPDIETNLEQACSSGIISKNIYKTVSGELPIIRGKQVKAKDAAPAQSSEIRRAELTVQLCYYYIEGKIEEVTFWEIYCQLSKAEKTSILDDSAHLIISPEEDKCWTIDSVNNRYVYTFPGGRPITLACNNAQVVGATKENTAREETRRGKPKLPSFDRKELSGRIVFKQSGVAPEIEIDYTRELLIITQYIAFVWPRKIPIPISAIDHVEFMSERTEYQSYFMSQEERRDNRFYSSSIVCVSGEKHQIASLSGSAKTGWIMNCYDNTLASGHPTEGSLQQLAEQIAELIEKPLKCEQKNEIRRY